MKNKFNSRITQSALSLLARLLLSRSLLRKSRNQNKETIVKGNPLWIPITIRRQ
jgi:hypothetical protein